MGEIDETMRAWESFITQVEQGYTMTIYEYSNDMSCRSRIGQMLPRLAEPEGTLALGELAVLDDRFHRATYLPERYLDRHESWQNRIPVLLVGELAEDVAEGRA